MDRSNLQSTRSANPAGVRLNRPNIQVSERKPKMEATAQPGAA
ncbi:hypothetical protein [Nostoc sp. FACHB-152]|nr:hypothetical protein [Nostoc sp. FACHB-152]